MKCPSVERGVEIAVVCETTEYALCSSKQSCIHIPWALSSDLNLKIVDELSLERASKARATPTLAFRVTSDAGDDGMVSRQTASPNASQSPLLSLVRRTANGPISPGVTSLFEPTCEVALSFHFGFVRLI